MYSSSSSVVPHQLQRRTNVPAHTDGIGFIDDEVRDIINRADNPHFGEYTPSPAPLSSGHMPLPDIGDPYITPTTNSDPIPMGALGAYMHDNQQLQALREHCKALEMQILKVTAEHDTVILTFDSAAFQTLANAVHIPVTDPLQFAGKPTPISPKCDPHCPNAQTHPKVHFWNKSDYLDWLDSLEATSSDHGKLPFLEDKIGNPISEAIVEAICKSLRGAWSELATHNLAPSSWGKLTASGTQLVNSIMESAHPIFKLAHNGWKLDFLATSSYSSWQRNHLDDFNNYRKAKRSDDNDDGNENEKPSSSKGKKQQYHVKHEAPMKKMKASSSTPEVWSLPEGLSSSPHLQTPSQELQCIDEPPQNLVQVLEEASEAIPEIAAPPVLAPDVVPAPRSPFKQQVPARLSPTRSLEDKENTPTIPAPKPIKVVNPLVALAVAAAQINFPPLPPISESALTNTSDSTKALTSKAPKTGGKAKMRPSPTRNGWCYADLMPDQCKKYDDEATELVADNAWTKGVCEGLLY
ncbi:hypothetical protein DFH29DRAFT_881021 [Suillus ampliporus]|nr:hypothetical protein DFH29DRAFT_881021 [Suillus ampliporus]